MLSNDDFLKDLGIDLIRNVEDAPMLRLPGQEVHSYISGRIAVGREGITKHTGEEEFDRMVAEWRHIKASRGREEALAQARRDLAPQTKQRIDPSGNRAGD